MAVTLDQSKVPRRIHVSTSTRFRPYCEGPKERPLLSPQNSNHEVFSLDDISCPKCSVNFVQKRKNQKYCSTECQKNGARGDRKLEHKRRNEEHYSRATMIMERLRKSHSALWPKEVAQMLVNALLNDPALKNILIDPRLLGDDSGRDNIATVADEICRYAAKKGVLQIIRDRDFTAIATVEQADFHPNRCPKPKPANWNTLRLYPQNLVAECFKSTSALNKEPEVDTKRDSQDRYPNKSENPLNNIPQRSDRDYVFTRTPKRRDIFSVEDIMAELDIDPVGERHTFMNVRL